MALTGLALGPQPSREGPARWLPSPTHFVWTTRGEKTKSCLATQRVWLFWEYISSVGYKDTENFHPITAASRRKAKAAGKEMLLTQAPG